MAGSVQARRAFARSPPSRGQRKVEASAAGRGRRALCRRTSVARHAAKPLSAPPASRPAPAFGLLGACPAASVDLGCGTGAWLRAAQATRRRRACLGLDWRLGAAGAADDPSQGRFLAADLAAPGRGGGPAAPAAPPPAGLATTLEVAEHLRARTRPRPALVGAAAPGLADAVLFSGRHPAQGGEQPRERAMARLVGRAVRGRGFRASTCCARRLAAHRRCDWWYAQNLLVFARAGSAAEAAPATPCVIAPAPRAAGASRRLARLAGPPAAPGRSPSAAGAATSRQDAAPAPDGPAGPLPGGGDAIRLTQTPIPGTYGQGVGDCSCILGIAAWAGAPAACGTAGCGTAAAVPR